MDTIVDTHRDMVEISTAKIVGDTYINLLAEVPHLPIKRCIITQNHPKKNGRGGLLRIMKINVILEGRKLIGYVHVARLTLI